MPNRDFDAARRERQRAFESIRWTLGGREFTSLPYPTLADSFALLDAPEPMVDGAPLASGVRALADYIERTIIGKRDQKRFRALLSRRDDPIDAETIISLGEWLAEQYSGRPTVRPSDFSDGSLTDGPTSNTTDSATDGVSVT